MIYIMAMLPLLWACNDEDDIQEIFVSGTWNVGNFYTGGNWDKHNDSGMPKYTKEEDLKVFAKEANRYGVVYCAIRGKTENKDGIVDILVRAEDAAKIAPCYYVPGNHESRIREYPEFRERLKKLGVKLAKVKNLPGRLEINTDELPSLPGISVDESSAKETES